MSFMDGVLSFTPEQIILTLAIYIWMFVIFPVLVLRKLNHITNLLEAQVYDDDEDAPFE